MADTFHTMRDRGRETSNALVEVRTVLSRAETALKELEYGEYDHAPDDCREPDTLGRCTHIGVRVPDEDYDEMRAALEQVVESLEWWRRTGRPRSR